MKYYETPELIARVAMIDGQGEETLMGDRVLGISVQQDKGLRREGTVRIDVRDLRKDNSLQVEISLPDLMLALASATLNRDSTS